MKGFDDTRGTLFFDIARILRRKKPRAFVLENVKQLRGHDGGRTLAVILETLDSLGYSVQTRVLNALDYGVPQKRERIFIVGFLSREHSTLFEWPTVVAKRPDLESILEPDSLVPPRFFVSEKIRLRRQLQVANKEIGSGRLIWHENKSGNISALPYSCALRAGASYNYLLVDGVRRLTPREMLRIQGYPDSFTIACSDAATRKQAGNSVPVPMVRAVISQVLKVLK
jgi:DNA (cytosine-5)-methyltransferase 1